MKQAYVDITPEVLVKVIREHYDSNLPKDAQIVWADSRYGDGEKLFRVFFVSDSFADIPEGGVTPRFELWVSYKVKKSRKRGKQ